MKTLRMFRDGDLKTKLSFLIMGFGCFSRGQILKGLYYLAFQVAYIYYFIDFGWYYLKDFTTLGTATKRQVWNEADQIYIYIQGDNSMLILLFSVFTILLGVLLVILWRMSIHTSFAAQKLQEEGKKLPNIREDLSKLLTEKYHITLLAFPSLLVTLFTILPIIFMILMAFTNFDSSHQPPGNLFTWVGLENFKNLFGGNVSMSNTFVGILIWTLIWAFFATFSNYILGMLLAMMINKKGIKFKGFWRTIFVITIAVPQFVTLMLMSQILHELGPLNVLLMEADIIQEAIPFLTDATLARITVIVVNIWVGVPYTMLITTGILMNIPADLYESAKIDGASGIKMFFKITLPYMLFVTTPYLITQFVANINNFNTIYLLTGGNPLSLDYFQAGKTDLLVTWLYKLTVNEQNYSLASTIGIFVFVITAGLSLLVYRFTAKNREEDFQ